MMDINSNSSKRIHISITNISLKDVSEVGNDIMSEILDVLHDAAVDDNKVTITIRSKTS